MDNLAKLHPDLYLTGHIEAAFAALAHLMRGQTRPHALLTQKTWQDLNAERRSCAEERIEAELAAQ